MLHFRDGRGARDRRLLAFFGMVLVLPAALSPEFIPLAELGGDVQRLHFELTIDGQVRQRGDTARMLFGIDRIIHHISQYITLKIGDLIYTGTPAGVGPVHPGDNLKASLEGHMLLDFDIR